MSDIFDMSFQEKSRQNYLCNLINHWLMSKPKFPSLKMLEFTFTENTPLNHLPLLLHAIYENLPNF